MNLTPIDEYGDKMTLKEFMEMCLDRSLIDYDGIGYYAFEDCMDRDAQVVPSDIMNGNVKIFYTHVVWYNR